MRFEISKIKAEGFGINQRTVNKKTLESLAYAGAFDCFPEHHRAQYFHIAEGETINGLEKIIKFGQVVSNQNATTANTLFGDMNLTMEIPPPRIPDCEPWSLTEQLDKEKEVTGMFLSGHPLDHYRFEMKHYGVTPIQDFNEFRESIKMQPNPGRVFRLLGLVADAQHQGQQRRVEVEEIEREHPVLRARAAHQPHQYQHRGEGVATDGEGDGA